MLKQKDFFKKYDVKKYYRQSGLKWDTLRKIYTGYKDSEEKYQKCCDDLEEYCRSSADKPDSVHSIKCRLKNPEHLIEKIIRKKGQEQNRKYSDINQSNYSEIVHDLIGMRILIMSKEDWESIFDWLIGIFPFDETAEIHMAEPPVAYTRYDDRDIFKHKIHKEHSNKGYRSQHYVVRFNGYYCEIQVRTLAEELYGEFDHVVKYPYRNDNNFLLRYTNTLSRLTDSIDEMISTCFQMKEQGWDACSEYFEKDEYLDWQRIAQEKNINNQSEVEDLHMDVKNKKQINISDYGNYFLLRKGR